MKKINHSTLKKTMLFCLLAFASTGFAQHFTVTLDNLETTSNTLEVDVMLIVDGTTTGVRLTAVCAGINYNPAILNGGTPCTNSSSVGCNSWVLIPGTIAPEIMANGVGGIGLNNIVTTNSANPSGHLRIVQASNFGSLVNILPGTYRIGRFRFTNTVPWAVDSDPELWLQPTNADGHTNTIVSFWSVMALI